MVEEEGDSTLMVEDRGVMVQKRGPRCRLYSSWCVSCSHHIASHGEFSLRKQVKKGIQSMGVMAGLYEPSGGAIQTEGLTPSCTIAAQS